MTRIAIILVHNKSDVDNFNQIEIIKSLIEKKSIVHDIYDPITKQPTGSTFTTFYYTIKTLPITHEVLFYQIIPFGVIPPTNRDTIDSWKVYYAKGDEDKVGNHPRFFNWGLKRGTDYGADVVVYLDDIFMFNVINLKDSLDKLINNTELIETSFGKISSFKLLQEVGQLKENITITEAFTDLKQRLTQKGLNYG